MPRRIVRIKGIGLIRFPESMTDDEILEVLRLKFPSTAEPEETDVSVAPAIGDVPAPELAPP